MSRFNWLLSEVAVGTYWSGDRWW